jgi:alanine racemase
MGRPVPSRYSSRPNSPVSPISTRTIAAIEPVRSLSHAAAQARWPGAVLHIDLDAIVANWRLLGTLNPAGIVGAVVKADAYGLGACPVAGTLYAAGCRHFFTATLDEALAIRAVVPDALLAVLNGAIPGSEGEFVRHDITPVLGSVAELAAWRGRDAPAILHIDTGMNRLGLAADDIAPNPEWLRGTRLSHVMSHLVSSELADDPLNEVQRQRFAAACTRLPPLPRSLANSSGIFLGPAFALELARPGAALYGLNPTPERVNPMRPVVRLRARVLQLRDVQARESRQEKRSATTPPGAPLAPAASPSLPWVMPTAGCAPSPIVARQSLTAVRCRW